MTTLNRTTIMRHPYPLNAFASHESGATHSSSRFLFFVITLAMALRASAGVDTFSWNSGFENAGAIPDGDVSGWSDARVISGITHSATTTPG
jgi:hypothetical protein